MQGSARAVVLLSQDGLAQVGLNAALAEKLRLGAQEMVGLSPPELLARAETHLDDIRQAHAGNPFVNVKLAEALRDRIATVVTNWAGLSEDGQGWLRGAIAYFVDNDDEVPDRTSPIGLEDDCEVINACLRLAGLDQHCIDPEDYDEL